MHKFAIVLMCMMLLACGQSENNQDKDNQYLQKKAQQQEYPTLIATPEIADYALPFCEQKYCIEIEIFDFKSQDQWVNQYTQQTIADLIRQQLGLSQKLSLQSAIDAFIVASDQWLVDHPKDKAWSMYIRPRVAMQQQSFALLVINCEYQQGDQTTPAQNYFFVVDRKQQRQIRLYDLIREDQRIAFSQMIQQQYQAWQAQQSHLAAQQLPEKLYWANQDWFFDEQGIAIYYRAQDIMGTHAALKNSNVKDLTIYLSPEQIRKWINSEDLKQLNLPV